MNRAKPKQNNALQLSKRLSWLLRHSAQDEGIAMKADGFVLVDQILQHPKYGASYTLDRLKEIVATDNKQRFTLRRCEANGTHTGQYEIRANQGHSLQTVQSLACMERINNAAEVPMAVHGTYYKCWQRIKTEGLKRMQRNHVHFTTSDKCRRGDVLSGFRNNSEVLIYLNVAKVLADQLPLYRSANNVILCEGVGHEGCISSVYFERVVDRRTGQSLL